MVKNPYSYAVGLALAFIFGVLVADCRAQSQKFYCSNQGEIAERMVRDMTTTELRPRHYTTEQERDLAVTAIHCAERGENIKACIVKHCMEEQS